MTNKNSKQWIEVLPLNRKSSLVDNLGNILMVFHLNSYQMYDGSIRFSVAVKDGPILVGGAAELKLRSNLSVRIHIPVELHRVPDVGLSPKVVYTLPKNYRIEEYAPPPQTDISEAVRHHSIIEH